MTVPYTYAVDPEITERVKKLSGENYKSSELWDLVDQNLNCGFFNANSHNSVQFNTIVRSMHTNKVITLQGGKKLFLDYSVQAQGIEKPDLEASMIINAHKAYVDVTDGSIPDVVLAASAIQPLGIVYHNGVHVINNVVVTDTLYDYLVSEHLAQGYTSIDIESYVPLMGSVEELIVSSLVVVGAK